MMTATNYIMIICDCNYTWSVKRAAFNCADSKSRRRCVLNIVFQVVSFFEIPQTPLLVREAHRIS